MSGGGRKCAGLECTKPAGSLKCPTCVKKKLPDTYFCSQACFKENWPVHKLIHSLPPPDPVVSLREEFAGFRFTGSLRPGALSPWRDVPAHIQRPDYAEDANPTSEMALKGTTSVKEHTPEEIEKARTVCKLAREVLDIGGRAVRPGVTTDEIDRIVHEACVERDSYPSPLNYHGFPKSCCTSVNEVICHGIPDSRELVEGDICNIDVTLYFDSFHGDLNATYPVGKIDDASAHLIKTTRECLDKAIRMCKPGTMYRSLGNEIQRHAKANGFSVVRTYCGHGIGELFHTTPSIPHYARNKAIGMMRPGHIFTIEPMINAGGWKDKLWPDEWTSATLDGSRSAQFEETMVVTETGVDVLTAHADWVPLE